MPHSVDVNLAGHPAEYRIEIGGGLLSRAGDWAVQCLGPDAGRRVVVVSNPKVYRLYGKTLTTSLEAAGLTVSSFLMQDGERHKNLRSAERAVSSLSQAALSRDDSVVALGGGVVGDLAGFSASIYLRGIRFLQIPTTLLSMIDSSVGGKTGVNTDVGKNLVGTFHQPSGVMIDPSVLRTLARREVRSGFYEAIKQGAIGNPALFEETAGWLAKYRTDQISRFAGQDTFDSSLASLIAAQIRFKAAIVAGDERETAARTDAGSRKILNFGHTLAHALEKVTGYRYLRHGEAVGYGILFAAELSKSLALCDQDVVKSLYDVVQSVGKLPPLTHIDIDDVLAAFTFDKKQVKGSLQMVLLRGIGKPVIIADVPRRDLERVLKPFLHSSA